MTIVKQLTRWQMISSCGFIHGVPNIKQTGVEQVYVIITVMKKKTKPTNLQQKLTETCCKAQHTQSVRPRAKQERGRHAWKTNTQRMESKHNMRALRLSKHKLIVVRGYRTITIYHAAPLQSVRSTTYNLGNKKQSNIGVLTKTIKGLHGIRSMGTRKNI